MQSKDRKPAPKMERTSTPGIFKRGSRYVVVWHHRGRQHKKAFRTKTEANAEHGKHLRGDTAPTTRATFEDYALEWLETYSGRTGRGIGKTTMASYRQAIKRHAIPHFGPKRKLCDIEPPDVRRFVRHLEGAGLAPSSVAKTVAPLRALLATAYEDGAIRSNPASAVRVSRRRQEESFEEERAKAMTRVELSAVLEECPEQWCTFFELLAHTGLRISEALGLDWTDVDLGAQTLSVRRQCYRGELRRLKSRDGRRDLPLSPGMAQRLWVLRPADGEGPVFHTRTGNRYSDRNVRRVLDAAADRAGVGWVSFHSFRHTCASLLFDAGKNVAQVAAWLGHSDPAFTLRTYVHLMDQGLGDAAFLDAQVGNRLATEDPASTANAEPPSVTKVVG